MVNFLELIKKAELEINKSKNIKILESIRIKYLGKKGLFNKKIKEIKKLNTEEKYIININLNKHKQYLQKLIFDKKNEFQKLKIDFKIKNEIIDISLPGRKLKNGGIHPISSTISRVEQFFLGMGFLAIYGKEIEDSYHNFDALNISKNHPARHNNDTFWIDSNRLLRTQTSSIQIRAMKSQSLPIRIITSGKVYRNDFDKTHTPMFHQTEGLLIDTNINFCNMKDMLYNFLYNFFEKKINIRFRPSYFPFTEPSVEIDIIDKYGNWLEVLGGGMVHPNVLKNSGINPKIYSGIAFGIGIERLTILRYDIKDLRLLFENDLRFLKQFK